MKYNIIIPIIAVILAGVWMMNNNEREFKKTELKFDYTIMLISIFVVWLLSLDNNISRIEGATLAGAYIYYIYYFYQLRRQDP